MRHRFEHYYKRPVSYGDTFYPPEQKIVVETEVETVDEILDVFQSYLKACGYHFDIDEHLTSLKDGED